MKQQTSIEKAKKRFMRGIYINREYSWLLFNKRVLDQATDLTNPLLERCQFLSIFSSNLDEFFMVRVGSLYNENLTDPNVKENKTGLTPAKQLEGILAVVRRQYQSRISAYIKLRGELNKAGVRILKASELTPRQSEECKSYFLAHVLPLLSMMVLDAKHPMMQFENRRHYMIYDLEREGRRMIGVTFLNPAADRLYRIGYGKKVKLVPVEELLKAYLPIRPQRIVRMKGYLAGDWYPMASNMRINDAKTVTAVGCALYAAGKSKLLGAIWNIAEDQAASDADTKKRSTDVKKRCRNYWGVMCSDSRQDGFDHILLAPKEETNERDTYVTDDGTTYHGYPIMINSYIGRQKYRAENSTPERQYKLRWKGDSRKAPNAPLTVIVRRKQPPTCGESYEMEEDDIELVSVECTDPSDTNFDSSLVELQLRTLSEAGFWMEECRFQCELPNV